MDLMDSSTRDDESLHEGHRSLLITLNVSLFVGIPWVDGTNKTFRTVIGGLENEFEQIPPKNCEGWLFMTVYVSITKQGLVTNYF